ncbi:hypothetical protein [Mycolicibacterium vaccae]|uniref:AbiEi antitoxin C-terminal domain-containing protein n=1 Tax=Mycolicibacterium vaccae ATCC 25954 TaxID=1194972 RepID=K0UYY8_MYCVA|nr:hypothetical protein [Mycolicibacterium vaccae]ANI41709.1 hypothetical protein MYVA_4632 [Mycolicibacterium vaccae 95051]EJZ11966.1 hypothetical protein MVAC_03471 [Mycolicibacterium vaccae ATCC 25954]MCV7062188.1 hypothetical protein [Mycolicibacterium vaccae]
MDRPFLGQEAIAAGLLTRGALRWHHRKVLPGVYLPATARRDTLNMAYAAWLWTGREGVIAGLTAAALHGVKGVDVEAPIEVIAEPRRVQPGVIVRHERLGADEIRPYGQMRITTPARTAFDLARRLPRDDAVVLLDMLSAVTGITRADVAPLRQRYRSARGTAHAYKALDLMDGGSRSPEETMVRLWLIDGGLPPPETRIHIGDHIWESVIGLGWPKARVAVQWAEHRYNLASDILFRDLLRRQHWQLIEVASFHIGIGVVSRCREALRRSPFR